MRRLQWLMNKLKAMVRKGPATLRNIVYSKFNYWPVTRLDGSELQYVPAYCISLTRATQKRQLMKKQVNGLGLTRFTLLDAVDAQQLNWEDLARDGRYNAQAAKQFHANGLTLNEIACSLSHGLAYAAVVANGDAVALILEDDALFISRRLRQIGLKDLPTDFDVVFLNTFISDEPPRGHLHGVYYDDTSYNGSAAAYLISQAGAQKLLHAHSPVLHAADGLLGRCMHLPPGQTHEFKQRGATTTINSYIVYPDCVLNGSTSYYHVSEVQPSMRNAQK